MLRLISAVMLAIAVFCGPPLNACVGKTLHIGVLDSPNELLLAELASQLISARTGTSVKIDSFKTQKDLYNSVKTGQVGMVIESTDRALEMLGRIRESGKPALDTARSEYRKSLNMIWLEPFGSGQGGNSPLYAPVIASDVLGSLPALPKLLHKLSGVTADAGYIRLLKAGNDERLKKNARDYLKSRKLI